MISTPENLVWSLIESTRPLMARHALVTGGSRGIGRAIVLELVRLGCTVEIGYKSNFEQARETLELANDISMGFCQLRQIDLAWQEKLITEIQCDILVNNAGISEGQSLRNMGHNAWQNTLDVNLTGTMKISQLCIQGMIERGWGRVINIVSVVGMDGRLGPSSYAASKAGLIGASKAWAHELASKGVTVNCVAPGFIGSTGMLEAVPERYKARILEQIPMKRYGSPEDVAKAVSYLVQADYVTGTVLNVSGGYLT